MLEVRGIRKLTTEEVQEIKEKGRAEKQKQKEKQKVEGLHALAEKINATTQAGVKARPIKAMSKKTSEFQQMFLDAFAEETGESLFTKGGGEKDESIMERQSLPHPEMERTQPETTAGTKPETTAETIRKPPEELESADLFGHTDFRKYEE